LFAGCSVFIGLNAVKLRKHHVEFKQIPLGKGKGRGRESSKEGGKMKERERKDEVKREKGFHCGDPLPSSKSCSRHWVRLCVLS